MTATLSIRRQRALGRGESPKRIRRAAQQAWIEQTRRRAEERYGRMSRSELVRARARGDIDYVEMVARCFILGFDLDEVESEADAHRGALLVGAAIDAVLDAVHNPTAANRRRMTRRVAAAIAEGHGRALISVLDDVAPGFVAVCGLDSQVRNVEAGASPRAGLTVGRAAASTGGVERGKHAARFGRARSAIGVRSSSGQRRTRNANGSPGGGDDGPQVGEPAPPSARLRFHLAPALIGGAA